MILTAEEYARGLIDFDAVIPEGCSVELWTRTVEQPGDDDDWTGPYSTPQGAKVLSPSKRYMQLRIKLNRGDDPTKTPVLKKVRWERDGTTCIWPGPKGFSGPPAALSLGKDYGCSYRLVFQPKRAVWVEPIAIVTPKARVRLWKGEIKGFTVTGFKDAEHTPNGGLEVEGTVQESVIKGDWVEVLATVPVSDADQAKEAARNEVESVVGLLALCFGEQILGKPVFEDYYFSNATGEQGHIHMPVKPLVELSIVRDLASLPDVAFSRLDASVISPSIGVALRWYAMALGSESLVDAFIAHFIGLEALAT